MTQDEIISMAREAGLLADDEAWVSLHQEAMERFAALVAAHERERTWTEKDWGEAAEWIRQQEREAIMDEWWMCVDSDLENGVKSLNERAAKKWHEEYPAISGFGEAIRARGEK